MSGQDAKTAPTLARGLALTRVKTHAKKAVVERVKQDARSLVRILARPIVKRIAP